MERKNAVDALGSRGATRVPVTARILETRAGRNDTRGFLMTVRDVPSRVAACHDRL
ncbi:MAG: hypothetical protein ABGZ17_23255 [Planctomycetaceae bacterium]